MREIKQYLLVKYSLSLAALLLPTFIANSAATARVTTRVIVLSEEPAPDGNGIFSGFFDPALNDVGQAAFHGIITGTSGCCNNNGIFRADGRSSPVQIARAGDSAPDGSGIFSFALSDPALNASGQAAFYGRFNSNNDGSGIFRGDGTSSLVQIARKGVAAPDGYGTFSGFNGPVLNDAGQVAFRGLLAGTSDNSGIFRGDGSGSLVQIAREGEATPDGNGTFSVFSSSPALNDAGQVAFLSYLNVTGSTFNSPGIFLGSGAGTIVQIARAGDAAPDGNGTFAGFEDPALNDSGQAAFLGGLSGTSGSGGDNRGVFRGNGAGTIVQIAREGEAAPDGNGTFSSFGDPGLNESGQVAFFGNLIGTSGGFYDSRGIFRGSGVSSPVQIARTGNAAPEGNGTFSDFESPALNAAGQLAFLADLTGTSEGSSDDLGLYFYDDLLGLRQVARTGNTFLGSTITSLGFVDSSIANGTERSGLNELGHIAYRFKLDDGRDGIAIASITPTGPDTDGDEDIDGIDFLTLQRTNPSGISQWQAEFGTEAFNAFRIPEPGTLLLGMSVSSTLMIRRKR